MQGSTNEVQTRRGKGSPGDRVVLYGVELLIFDRQLAYEAVPESADKYVGSPEAQRGPIETAPIALSTASECGGRMLGCLEPAKRRRTSGRG